MRRALGLTGAALAAVGLGALLLSAATPTLLWVQKPSEGEVFGVGGVEVLVRFPHQRRVEVESFRLLLNGADVTSQVTTGSNGASGKLYGLLEGENLLRFEIRGDWGGYPAALVEQAREVRVLVRLPQNLNRG